MVASLWKASQSLSQWHPLGTLPFMVASLLKTSQSLSQSQPLKTVPFQVANLWQASLSLSLWRPLGTLPSEIAGLWQASLSLSQWQSLGEKPLENASLWKASQSLSQWHPLGTLPFMVANLWQASLSLSLWGTMSTGPLVVICNREYGMFDAPFVSCNPPGTSFSSSNRLGQCGLSDQLCIISGQREERLRHHISDLTWDSVDLGEISLSVWGQKRPQKKTWFGDEIHGIWQVWGKPVFFSDFRMIGWTFL